MGTSQPISEQADDAAEDGPWYREGLHFTCHQCGNCCTGPPGYVWFNEAEGRAMAAHLGVSEATFYEQYARRANGKWSLREVKRNGQYDCVFLQRDGQGKALCGVYPARPKQCATWPFWPENLASREAWDEVAKDCPGMRHGKDFFPVDQIRIIRDSNP
jgi:Fe-S-cluster containining protein